MVTAIGMCARRTTTISLFAVGKGITKLSDEMATHPDKHLVVHSVLPQALDPVQALRAEFLTRASGALQSESFTVAPLNLPEMEVDKSGHPTEAGTAAILGQIHDQCRDKIIKTPAFVTSSGLYAGVQSLFLSTAVGPARKSPSPWWPLS